MSELEIYKGMVKKMKDDEIKEILDKLRETADYPKLNYSSYDKSYNETIDNVATIKSFACKQLLDYITNLQHENEELKEGYCELKVKCNNGICDCSYEEYHDMCEKNMEMNLLLEDYKSRIEKATKDLFELKDMIYKPETRDENMPIQQKISSIIKQLNDRSDK